MECQIVTGGAGFIGSCYVLQARSRGVRVVTLDRLTYAGNLENLSSLAQNKGHILGAALSAMRGLWYISGSLQV